MNGSIRASAIAIAALGLQACDPHVGREDYGISETGGTVIVCLETHSTRTCPDLGLLREEVSSGDVVRIATCEGDCFVDECVPAGAYRYGLAEAYSCEDSIYDTAYFGEVEVVGAEGCTRTRPEPEPDSGVPWGEYRIACPGPSPYDAMPFLACSTGLGGGTTLTLLLAGLALRHLRTRRA